MTKFLESFKWINLSLLIGNICPFQTTFRGHEWIISQKKAHFWVIFFINCSIMSISSISAVYAYLLKDKIMRNWNVQIGLTFISLVTPVMIYQVNILAVFAKGEEHAGVFRTFAKFEKRLKDILSISVDFTYWKRKMYLDFVIAFIYGIASFVLKSQYYFFEDNWTYIYHITLLIIDLNFLLIVCHIRSTVRCLRVFQRHLSAIFQDIAGKPHLKLFHTLNRELMGIKREVDRTFGPLLLINISYDFIALIFQLYFYFHFLDFRFEEYYNFWPHMIQIFKITGLGYKAVAFVTEMETYYSEAKQLADKLRKKPSTPTDFFYQSLHMKNWEYFTASQFFNLNFSLVNNFFTGCITYIIIMFQLEILDNCE
uniref:Gustatory receptor n=1 Tax=Phlebotomus papatasi TaxID=29031 RepID=A0A3F2ZE96_PHLPP